MKNNGLYVNVGRYDNDDEIIDDKVDSDDDASVCTTMNEMVSASVRYFLFHIKKIESSLSLSTIVSAWYVAKVLLIVWLHHADIRFAACLVERTGSHVRHVRSYANLLRSINRRNVIGCVY